MWSVSFGRSDPNNANFIIPSAFNSNSWQIWLAALLYLGTALFAAIECARAYAINRGVKTYRFNFLIFSFLFAALRGLMTLITFPDWKQHMSYLYFLNEFLPHFLQYYIFSLLALFVVQMFMVFDNKEDQVEPILYRAYHSLQVVLLIGCILASSYLGRLFDSQPDTDERVKTWDQVASIYNVVLYGILTVVGGYFSYRCYLVLSTMMLSERQRVQQNRYLALTVLFCVIFTCRFIWCLLYFEERNPIMSLIETYIVNNDQDKFDSSFLIFYLIFEIFPTFVVVLAFRPPFSCFGSAIPVQEGLLGAGYKSPRPSSPRASSRGSTTPRGSTPPRRASIDNLIASNGSNGGIGGGVISGTRDFQNNAGKTGGVRSLGHQANLPGDEHVETLTLSDYA